MIPLLFHMTQLFCQPDHICSPREACSHSHWHSDQSRSATASHCWSYLGLLHHRRSAIPFEYSGQAIINVNYVIWLKWSLHMQTYNNPMGPSVVAAGNSSKTFLPSSVPLKKQVVEWRDLITLKRIILACITATEWEMKNRGNAQSEQQVHISCKTGIPHVQIELRLFFISKYPERMNLHGKRNNENI